MGDYATDIVKYHQFISGSLKPSVNNLETVCEELKLKIQGCENLCSMISNDTNEPNSTIETKSNIGENYSLDVVIKKRRFLVETGVLGIYIDMSAEETREFAHVRGKLLADRLALREHQLEGVMNDLKYAQDILKQLQELPFSNMGD